MFKALMGIAAVMTLAAGVYASAASNTVPASNAGSGSGAISGYTVSNVQYTISGSNITGVSFDISPTSHNTLAVSIANGPSTSVSGTGCSGAGTVTCNFSGLSAADALTLTVTAAN